MGIPLRVACVSAAAPGGMHLEERAGPGLPGLVRRELRARQEELVGEICRRRRVRKLEIFGSAIRPGFDPDRSDVDLIAHFDPREDLLDAYFGKAELEALFGRPVDPLTVRPVRNPRLAGPEVPGPFNGRREGEVPAGQEPQVDRRFPPRPWRPALG